MSTNNFYIKAFLIFLLFGLMVSFPSYGGIIFSIVVIYHLFFAKKTNSGVEIKTKEQWDILEKPLIEIDDELMKIAKRTNSTIIKNYHEWPSRDLHWMNGDGMNRKLDIALEDSLNSFQVVGYAWRDNTDGQRFIKILHLKKKIQPPLRTILGEEIVKYIDLINKIKKEELKDSV